MKQRVRLLVIVSAAFLVAGCFNPFSPRILTERVTSLAPSPNTPRGAVELFQWCWKNRAAEEYSELFTDDYVFQSASVDSAGNGTREIQSRRQDEVEIATNMFLGSAERAPASTITLNFDGNLRAFDDTRAGKNPTWHQTIRTSVDLKVDIGDGSTLEVTGFALFYLVRGDSAAIPAELKSKGFKPDPARWWIDRWEDETLPSGGSAAARASHPETAGQVFIPATVGEVKALYRNAAPVGRR